MPHSESKYVEVRGGGQAEYTTDIDTFKKDRGIGFVLAFSGSADFSSPIIDHMAKTLFQGTGDEKEDAKALAQLKEDAGDEYISGIVHEVLKPLKKHRIAILTGGTRFGVPKVASRVAKELGFQTIGVFPLVAAQKGYALSQKELDMSVCVHPFIGKSTWGDEAAIYTKLLNAVVIIGGKAGTMVEVAHLLKYNEPRDIVDEEVKCLVPILGTGGTADVLPFFPGKPETMAKCLPEHPILSGTGACEYLKDRMYLEDYYD